MLKNLSTTVLERLLSDRSTGQNILWRTDNYQMLGETYQADCPLTADNVHVVQPRSRKSEEEQLRRTRSLGEVFTPVPIVRLMVDSCQAPSDWQAFVTARWLEVSCGEAPFLTTPYDSITGEAIPLPDRCGVLDRKLQAVSDNTDSESDWLCWAAKALQSVYGFELQGDSLLIARRNLLSAYREHLQMRWHRDATEDECLHVADILSWNLWQMDALQGVEPECDVIDFLFSIMGPPVTPDPPDCLLMDWVSGKKLKWGDTVKFDFVIGNPPYQDDEKTGDQKNYSPPLYHKFWEMSKEVGDVVELITPARFLFNAGSTPKEWNEQMLNDPHFKVLDYEPDASKMFPKQDIKGGIVVGLWDRNQEFGAIGTFTPYPELNGIIEKVTSAKDFASIMEVIYIQNRFNLEALYQDHPEYKEVIGSNGKDSRFEKNIFVKVPSFSVEEITDGIKTLGIYHNKRSWRYIPSKYVDPEHENLSKYKVVVPVANGSGAFGQALSSPLVECPYEAYTRSFIGIGAFQSRAEAESALKYIKSKFARAMLSILKTTQMTNKDVWKYVPLQNFTVQSDIDWDKSITEIDRQLYAKYGLSEEETAFIESKVKPME